MNGQFVYTEHTGDDVRDIARIEVRVLSCDHANTTTVNAADADCVNNGYTGDTVCDDCGETIATGTVIPATGHINTTTNTTPADCDTDGLTTVTCECGHVVSTTVIPATGHTETVVNAKDAVINGEAGYTGDIVCGVCDELISEGSEIVATFENGRYYENGKVTPYKGLVEIDGDLYYINDGGRPVTGRYYISRLNGLVASGGAYYFDENGAMVKNGVYNGYYYENGKVKPYAGMIKDGDDVYYVEANGAVKTGRYAPVNLNGYAKGVYNFGTDGKMLKNAVVNGYYYNEDGLCLSYLGLKLVDGAYYYVNDNGKVVADCDYYISRTNGLLKAGKYTFGADGKIVL